MLSILVPSLHARAESFAQLHSKLTGQVRAQGLEDQVEIVSLVDGGERSAGVKRNELMDRARGEFVASVDDDDDVNQNYVPLILETLKAHPDVDCIGIKGLRFFCGEHPHVFIYSIRFREYRTKNGVYLRPPHHLNPIRREIAARYRFEDVSYSEDADWAMRMCRDRVLRREAFIDDIIYYYYSRRSWTYQHWLDRTERLRHPLGLQLVNRLRFRRWLRENFRTHRPVGTA
jgi:hypothetical protein